ncbi:MULTISPECIES: SulP family inorganic anion transporter [Spirosoma]|uniref:SulP family inorganic anion transporter n=1 Tax=Spirosoma liriopis TaxID=2937440 RepID=A0ABT0HKI4_9BACT|nr:MULTISPECIES: SulP family inorganic anion transporter [Spirosoma]MCK8492651.1 SulP family inorganic anion transporter [Spirosoma liriopis]UHG92119.1 SulP family inorganic anion transporter [Spirosoma oryzicola]
METKKSFLQTIDFSNLQGDFRGGAISFLVAVPLCLGIALASGAPLFAGIIAGIVGGIVVGAFSRSAVSISGPEAGLIIVTLSAIQALGSFPAFLLATCLAGLIQIGLGFAKAGMISNFFPSSVIKGMLAGIGIILIIKQLPHLVGYDADAAEGFALFQPGNFNIIEQLRMALGQFRAVAILIAVLSLGIFFLWERPALRQRAFVKNVPAALVVVLLGIGINEFFRMGFPEWALRGNHLVQLPVPESAAAFLNLFTFPDFSQWNNPLVYTSAVSIALVASLEALLAIEASDELDPLKRKTPTNHELKAQGIGNLVSGLVGGIPLTSVIVRSSVSINAGARTKVAALVHGTLLLVCVVTLPTLLNKIPWASLAAILLVTGYKLARIEVVKGVFAQGMSKFIPFVVTVVAILLTDLLIGIGIGMVAGIFFILRDHYLNAHRVRTHWDSDKDKTRIYVRLGDHVSFLSKARLMKLLKGVPDNAIVEIDGTNSSYIDSDVVTAIQNFGGVAKQRNIQLIFRQEQRNDYPFSHSRADIAMEVIE